MVTDLTQEEIKNTDFGGYSEQQFYGDMCRVDVQGETTAANLTKMLGASLKPIGVSADLLVYLDPAKRLAFLKQWQQAIGSR